MALLLYSTLTKQRGSIFDDILPTVNKIDGPGEVTMTDRLSFAALTKHLNSNDVLTYSGSLTTPPCKEGVRWLISSVPVSVSAAHVDAVRKILGYSARDVQGELEEPNLMADTTNTNGTTEATASAVGSMTTQTNQATGAIGADGTSTLSVYACSTTTAAVPAAPTTLMSQLPVATPVSSGVWPQQPHFGNGTSKAN